MANTVTKEIKKAKSIDKKIEVFGDLLDKLANTEDKKKLLWKEAYENALYDRENANFLLSDLLMQVKGNISLHTSLGSIMSKYLERMSKSNDQILKLAELLSKEEQNDELSPDDIFSKIQG